MTRKIKSDAIVFMGSGYNNSVQIGVELDSVRYVIDKDHAIEILERTIHEKGYEIRQTKKQKYPRVFINK